MTSHVFSDRTDAGRRLSKQLMAYANRPDVMVLALPRGGVPVGFEVARALGVPLDVFIVRKLGVPGHEEFAMGAMAAGGVRVLNDALIEQLGLSALDIDRVVQREQAELDRREQLYRNGRPPPDVRGRSVLLIDDGLATGSTMLAAVKAVRSLQPERIVVAVPAGAGETCAELRGHADEVVCLSTPQDFRAVGQCYQDFSQTSDDEVRMLLDEARPPAR